MRLSARKSIFLLILVVACGYANAGSIARRVRDDDSNVLSRYINYGIDMIRGLPLIGNSIAGMLEWTVQAISLFEVGTNGAIARLLGGALPCKVTLNATTCTGLTNNGGFGALLMDTVNGIPSLVLPEFAKSLIKLSINMLAQPVADLLFGGVVVDNP